MPAKKRTEKRKAHKGPAFRGQAFIGRISSAKRPKFRIKPVYSITNPRLFRKAPFGSEVLIHHFDKTVTLSSKFQDELKEWLNVRAADKLIVTRPYVQEEGSSVRHLSKLQAIDLLRSDPSKLKLMVTIIDPAYGDVLFELNGKEHKTMLKKTVAELKD